MDLISAINTSAIYALRAEKDSEGRTISSTYLTAVPSEYITEDELSAATQDFATVEQMSEAIAEAIVSSTSGLATTGELDYVSGQVDTKLNKTSADTLYYPLNSNPNGYLVADDISGKLDKAAFDEWSAGLDFDTYSAGANINITDHVISGKDWTDDISGAAEAALEAALDYADGLVEEQLSAVEAASSNWNNAATWVTTNSADNASKTWVNEQIGDLVSYTTASVDQQGYPDVQDPSTKTIYLTKDTTVTGVDKWKEWIVTGTTPSTGWELIGDTSMNLTNYATSSWVDTNYVSKTSTANWDVTEYTAANNYIDITNHGVSGYDWTDTITASATAASAAAVANVEGKFGTNTADEITGYNGSAFAAPDLSDYVTTAENELLSADVAVLTGASATWNGKQDALTNEQLSAISSVSGKQDTLTFSYAHFAD